MNNTRLGYIPIDIDPQFPDEKKIVEFCEEHYVRHPGFFKTVKLVPVLSKLTDEEWLNLDLVIDTMQKKYAAHDRESIYYKNVDKLFPEIPYMLEQLPFKDITFAMLLVLLKEQPCHMDFYGKEVVEDPYQVSLENEPHRYNIQLTKHGQNKFYLSEKFQGERIYTTVTEQRPAYAFCERYYWHGAEYATENSVTLAVFGILDLVKHKDCIIKNLIKYRDEAIIFPDPTDPLQYNEKGEDLYYP